MAEGAYIIANTPLFLLRNLLSDPAVAGVAHDTPSADILAELQRATARKPSTLTDKVLPFILLTALAIKGDVHRLAQTAHLRPDAKPHWFSYLASVLLDTTCPFSVTSSVASEVPLQSSALAWNGNAGSAAAT
jgi:hypothetical protein